MKNVPLMKYILYVNNLCKATKFLNKIIEIVGKKLPVQVLLLNTKKNIHVYEKIEGYNPRKDEKKTFDDIISEKT